LIANLSEILKNIKPSIPYVSFEKIKDTMDFLQYKNIL